MLGLLPLALFAARIAIFTPPDNWQATRPSGLSPHVQVGFVGPTETSFRPSLNLAREEIDCTLAEYLEAVKTIHQSQPKTRWRSLGPFQTAAGTGHLAEISSVTPSGPVQLLQAIFVEEPYAYILTAAVHRREFLEKKEELIASLRSLALIDDLSSLLSSAEEKTRFVSLLAALDSSNTSDAAWQAWKSFILACRAPGEYWQYLALQEGRNRMNPQSQESP
jgi:hypothetical protein